MRIEPTADPEQRRIGALIMRATRRGDSGRIFAVGSITAAVYLTVLIFYSTEKSRSSPIARQLFICFVVATLAWLYARGYQVVNRNQENGLKLIVGLGAVLALIALLIPPFDSPDVFAYVTDGWKQQQYHLNPYVTLSANTIPGWKNDSMFTREWYWMVRPAPYGFLFEQLCRLVCRISGPNVTATVMLLKATNLLAFGAVAFLIAAIHDQLNLGRKNLALYCYLWNPLLLLQVISMGHNDILMALFLVLAVYFAVVEAWFLVVAALVLGASIKVAAGFVIPFAIVITIKRGGLAQATLGLILGGLLGWLTAVPYLSGNTFLRLAQVAAIATGSHGSLETSLYNAYAALAQLFPMLHSSLGSVNYLLEILVWLGCLIWLSIELFKFAGIRNPCAENFIATALVVQLVVICVASSKYFPWYLGMFFPLAMLLESDEWLRRLVLTMSLFQLGGLTFLGYTNFLDYLIMIALPGLWYLVREWPEVGGHLLMQRVQGRAQTPERSERRDLLWSAPSVSKRTEFRAQ
jgi:hypothetical protein